MAFNGILYDKMYKGKPYAQEVDRILPYLKGKSILDIGGGTGSHALLLKEKGFAPHVLDISPSMLEVASRKGLSVEYGDIRTYRSVYQYDSAIALFHVLNFCSDLREALTSVYAALKADGVFIFDVWDPRVKKEGLAWLYDGLMSRFSWKKWKGNEVHISFFFPFLLRFERNHLFCAEPTDLRSELQAVGFRVEKFEENGMSFFVVAQKHSKLKKES